MYDDSYPDETLIKILEIVEQTKSNKKTLEAIVKRTADLSLTIVEKCKGATEARFQQSLGDNLKTLLVAFEEARNFFVEAANKSPGNSKWRKAMRALKRFFSATKDKDALKSLSEALDHAIADFLLLSNLDQLLQLDRLDGDVSRVLVGVDRIITGADDDRLRMRLKPVARAVFSANASPARPSDGTSVPMPASTLCHEGTFVDLLQELVDWATLNDARRVFWLYGQAGTGKSTVARTLCNRLANGAVAEARITASFFISRLAEADRRDPLRIIHTLSYYLARQIPTFRTRLLEVLESSAEVTERGVVEQFDKLFAKPLVSCVNDTPPAIVIVLDAVDECDVGYDRLGLEGGDLVPLLLSTVKETQLPIRLLVTSRSTPSITRMLRDYRPQAVSQSRTADFVPFLYERSIEVSLLHPDIRRYFYKEFGIIAEHYNLPDWPAPAAIDNLVKQANGLFIYADTVVRFVLGGLDPKKNLQVLVSTSTSTSSPIEYANLDNTYTRVLETAAVSIAGPRASQNNAALIRRLLHTLAVLQTPRSATDLSRLLGVEEDGEKEVDTLLSRLAAVLTRSDAGEISFYHASFPDYLLDETRCSDERFRGSRTNAHCALGIRCLEIMNQSLRGAIARLGDVKQYVISNDDVRARISETFSSELIYAITYWHRHFLEMTHGGSFSSSSTRLETFCKEHLLHWIEASSWLGMTAKLESILLSCCQATFENRSLAAGILRDAARFFPYFREHAAHEPGMVYVYAALFLPDCDLLRAVFASLGETSLPVQVVRRAASWDDLPLDLNKPSESYLQHLFGHRAYHMQRLLGSPDGSLILVASRSHRQTDLRLYDTFSGALLPVLTTYDKPIAVAFSPPGDFIALLTKHDIYVWNHASHVHASCSFNFPTGYDHVLAMAFQHGHQAVCVLLSNGSHHLVVTLTVDYNGDRIRFGETTHRPLGFPPGDTESPQGVSPHDLSGAYYYTGEYCAIAYAFIVNVYRGNSRVATLETPSAVSVLQFSLSLPQGGPFLAAGGAGGSVVVWSVETKAIIHRLAGLSDDVKSLAFSRTMVAAATKGTAAVWSLDDSRCIWNAQMHTDGIVLTPPAPLSNARLFAMIEPPNRDGEPYVRGLSLAAALTPPIYESVDHMRFSPTDGLLYSVSRSAVSIWDVQTGRYLQSFPYDTSRDSQEEYYLWYKNRREASWDTCVRHGLLLCMSPSQTPSWARDSTGQWVPHEVHSDCHETTTTPESHTPIPPLGSHQMDEGPLYVLKYNDERDGIWLYYRSYTPGHRESTLRLLFPVPFSKRLAPKPSIWEGPGLYPRLIWSENGEYLAIGHSSGDVTMFKLSAEIAHLLTLRDTAECRHWNDLYGRPWRLEAGTGGELWSASGA